jgi:uncharacterized protein (TIGR02271 family)
MIDNKMVSQLQGRQAYDRDGKKLGRVGQVYVDDRSGSPVWASVNTGLFGMSESFVPLHSAAVADQDLKLAVSKDQVQDAPRVDDTHDHISPDEEQRLHRHYAEWAGGGDATTHADSGTGHGRDAPAKDAAQSMTRSEERLRVGTESVETGQVRLRKYVVTEEQQVTVPVSHEEVRLEREPIRDGQHAGRATIGEEEQSVTLHAERPVVDKKTEAVEQVRLGTETVTEDTTVSDEVRKERVEVDDPQNQLRPGEGRTKGH